MIFFYILNTSIPLDGRVVLTFLPLMIHINLLI